MSDEQLSVNADLDEEGFVSVLEAHRELNDAKVQLESLLDATDSLEGLIGHLEAHDVVSEAHKQALVVSVENLLMGSPITVAEFLPSLESHQQGMVSTESLKETLRELWKKIVSFTLALLNAIKGFWKSISTYRGQLRHQAEHLVKLGSIQRNSSMSTDEVQLGIEIKSFMIGASAIHDPDAVIRGLSAALDQYRIVTTNYGKGMLEVGRRFEQALSGETSGQELLAEVCEIFDDMPVMSIASKVRALSFRDPRFGRRMVMAAPPVIGGYTLYFLTVEDDTRAAAEGNLVNFAQALRTTGVKFTLTNVNRTNAVNGTMKRASGQQVQVIAKSVIDALDTLEAQERNMGINKIESQVKNVLRAGERFQSRVYDADTFDQNTLRFVRNYTSWAVGPIDQMTNNLLTVSRNLLTYCRKSLKH